jgi:flagellar biosynthesis GTPase FlhF
MTVPTLTLPDAAAGITLPITPPATPPVVPPAVFTAADIEAARKQEKDKLYAKVESWESKFMEQGQVLANLMKAKDADVQAAKDEATKAAEEAAAKSWEEKDSKTLVADVRAELEAKLAEMARQNELERETFAKERSFTELRDYAQAKVSEALAANEIAPELVTYVTGNNTSEIDASLIRVKATTETLLSSFAEATAAQHQTPPLRGVSPTGYTTAGPMDADLGHKTFSAQDIKDMSMEEYASKRGAFLGAAAQSGRSQGMFA